MFLHSFYLLQDVTVYQTDVTISGNNIGGLNLDSDKLHFGLIPENSPRAYRKMEFQNGKTYPISFRLKMDGDMSEWISYQVPLGTYSSMRFVVQPGESKEVKIVLDASEDEVTKDEYYTGQLRVVVRRTTILDKLLPTHLVW